MAKRLSPATVSLAEVIAKATKARDEWVAGLDAHVDEIVTDQLNDHLNDIILSQIGLDRAWHGWRVLERRNDGTRNALYAILNDQAQDMAASILAQVGPIILTEDEIARVNEAAHKSYVDALLTHVEKLAIERAKFDAMTLVAEAASLPEIIDAYDVDEYTRKDW